jgi:hypothetical protein
MAWHDPMTETVNQASSTQHETLGWHGMLLSNVPQYHKLALPQHDDWHPRACQPLVLTQHEAWQGYQQSMRMSCMHATMTPPLRA